MGSVVDAVYNSRFKAVDTTGHGETIHALAIDPIRQLFASHGRCSV